MVLLRAVSLGLIFCCAAICQAADLQEIVRRAGVAMQADWAADPSYACVETDEIRKGEKGTARTFQLLTIDGSDYHLPLAPDGRPLQPDEEKAELLKLKDEVARRHSQSPAERQHRIEVYKKQRDEDGALLLGFSTAFTFRFLREETKDGHTCYVLSATPREGVTPTTLAAKVLAGMKGTVWIDKDTFHAVHVECDAYRAVPVYGILARVMPGTHIELAMAPASESVWLINEVSMDLSLSKLHLLKSREITRSTYSQYRPNDVLLEELLIRARREAQ